MNLGCATFRKLVAGPTCGQFAPAVPKARAGHTPFPADLIIAEAWICPRLGPQPFQQGTRPPQPTEFQGQPRRRFRKVARPSCSLTDCYCRKTGTGSYPYDRTNDLNRAKSEAVQRAKFSQSLCRKIVDAEDSFQKSRIVTTREFIRLMHFAILNHRADVVLDDLASFYQPLFLHREIR